ncbi:hypothetical protein EUX53_20210 [Pseudomonas orientalis]|nr:hypothetical protein EUX53_20210 [Pseudomonas orientalis]
MVGGQPRHESRTVQAACQGGHCCILLFYCDATLVLWWAVVEEVFSTMIERHARNPMWEGACSRWGCISQPSID